MEKRSKGKIVIVGAGFVGASTAFAIASSGIASELVLVDVNKDKADGEAMDLNHGLPFAKRILKKIPNNTDNSRRIFILKKGI